MKKFLKIFIIALLVLAVIGGTVFLFFRKNKKEDIETGSIVDFISSNSKIAFSEKLSIIDSHIISKDEADNRVDLLIETNEKLDEILFVLTSYYVESDTSIQNKAIKNKLDELNSKNKTLLRMSEEYCVKSGYFINDDQEVEFKTTNFDEHLGLNDLYIEMSSYLVNYAELVQLINQSLNVDRSSDIKFNMFDIYANIVKNTFSSTTGSTSDKTRVQIESSANISKINDLLIIRNLNVVKLKVPGNPEEGYELLASKDSNNFNKHYADSNKEMVARKFAEYISSANTATTSEEKSIKYLKLIYGI